MPLPWAEMGKNQFLYEDRFSYIEHITAIHVKIKPCGGQWFLSYSVCPEKPLLVEQNKK